MTKETKIGLLVGLTFIILFAIILSEKGATNNATQPSNLTVVDRSRTQGTMLHRTNRPLDGVGNLPIHTTVPPVTNARTVVASGPILQERPVGIPFPVSDADIPPLSKSVVSRLNVAPMAERQVEIDQVGPNPDTSIPLVDAVANAILNRTNTNDRLVINRESDEITNPPAQRKPTDDRRREREVRRAPVLRIVANHKVKSGESLGKVAARYYGRSTPARINAIFDVNRDRLTSIHAVRVGDKLRIPAIPDADGIAYVDASNFAGARVANALHRREDNIRIPIPQNANTVENESPVRTVAPARKPTNFNWYEVRENDTLSRIAKRELGNDRLYLKVYDMNRDLLPNKNAIKPGMKIRLPLVRAGDRVSSADVPHARRHVG